MASQPQRAGKVEEIDEDLKRVLDEHIEVADTEQECISREDLLRNGLRKLKRHMPRLKYRLANLAEREVGAAAQFFEDRKEGPGGKFYWRVDEAIGKIGLHPEGFRKVYKNSSPCSA